MPIKGLTDVRRLPRIGKIRLGVKRASPRTGAEYPVATPYFVCPPEVQQVYGEKPTRLDIIIPVEDDELWASQYYRQYSRSRGLVCKGDGVTCRRMIDTGSGAIAGRDTKSVRWEEGAECLGRDCSDYIAKSCQEVMNLQVILPKVPGLGIWQIDTGSINSIRNINDCATMIRAACGKVSWIPLTLTLEPTEVVNPDDGKKKTVYCMHLRHEKGLGELMEAASRPKTYVLIGAPVDDEAPGDKLLGVGTPENREELVGQVEDDIEDLWGEGALAPRQGPTTTELKQVAQAVNEHIDRREARQAKPAPVQASGSPGPVPSPAVRREETTTPDPATEAKTQKSAAPLTEAEREFDAMPSASANVIHGIDVEMLKKVLVSANKPQSSFIAYYAKKFGVPERIALIDFLESLTPEQAQQIRADFASKGV